MNPLTQSNENLSPITTNTALIEELNRDNQSSSSRPESSVGSVGSASMKSFIHEVNRGNELSIDRTYLFLKSIDNEFKNQSLTQNTEQTLSKIFKNAQYIKRGEFGLKNQNLNKLTNILSDIDMSVNLEYINQIREQVSILLQNGFYFELPRITLQIQLKEVPPQIKYFLHINDSYNDSNENDEISLNLMDLLFKEQQNQIQLDIYFTLFLYNSVLFDPHNISEQQVKQIKGELQLLFKSIIDLQIPYSEIFGIKFTGLKNRIEMIIKKNKNAVIFNGSGINLWNHYQYVQGPVYQFKDENLRAIQKMSQQLIVTIQDFITNYNNNEYLNRNFPQ